MPDIKIELAPEDYRVIIDGDESDWCEYGEPLDWTSKGQRYIALVGEVGEKYESGLGTAWVVAVKATYDTVELEEVDGEEEGDEVEEVDEVDEVEDAGAEDGKDGVDEDDDKED